MNLPSLVLTCYLLKVEYVVYVVNIEILHWQNYGSSVKMSIWASELDMSWLQFTEGHVLNGCTVLVTVIQQMLFHLSLVKGHTL